jgi:hypothetical protein
MTNIFSGLISQDFKNLYTSAIDSLLEQGSLSLPCKLKYSGSQNSTLCNNCVYDPISKLSANIYNNTGPNSFSEGSICPVCLGMGMIKSDSSEVVHMLVLFDSKYWLNMPSQLVNIPEGMVQTICLTSLLPKIRNANEVVFDTTLEVYGNYVYERAGDPMPVGLGDNRYIITMWKRK